MSKRQRVMACPRALTIKEVFLRYPMLARTLARVERLMRKYEPSQVPLDDSDAHIYQQEQTALDDVRTLYHEMCQQMSPTLPYLSDMTRLKYCLICFKARNHIAVHVTVEWNQDYRTSVVIVRESTNKVVQFFTLAEDSSQAARDVLNAFRLFNNLPDEPMSADDAPDPMVSSIRNAGYSYEDRLEILESNEIAYEPNDVGSDIDDNPNNVAPDIDDDWDGDDHRAYSSSDEEN